MQQKHICELHCYDLIKNCIVLTYSWGFLSIHREPIQALVASPALFLVNDAKCLEKSAWEPSFHVQLFISVLKKTSHTTDQVHTVPGSKY